VSGIAKLFYDSQTRRLGPFFRGHILGFERRGAPAYSSTTGFRLLVIFLVLEFVSGPRIPVLTWLGLAPPVWLRVPILLAISVLAVRLWAKVSFSDIGFLSWRNWSTTEKLYFAQVVILANAIFIVVYSHPLGFLQGRSDVWPAVAAIVVVEFIWGFYQEFNYRGILQTELTRRFGGVWGPLTANVVFTLGPLHFYHFTSTTSWSSTATILAATFSIGLLFAFIFHRTRNIWLVGVFHGIGNAYMNGAAEIALLSP
jgi:membrane protease YdiL (CAAX protease family)